MTQYWDDFNFAVRITNVIECDFNYKARWPGVHFFLTIFMLAAGMGELIIAAAKTAGEFDTVFWLVAGSGFADWDVPWSGPGVKNREENDKRKK